MGSVCIRKNYSTYIRLPDTYFLDEFPIGSYLKVKFSLKTWSLFWYLSKEKKKLYHLKAYIYGFILKNDPKLFFAPFMVKKKKTKIFFPPPWGKKKKKKKKKS